ncbi:MAG: hypothetical protein NHB14_01495 [Desulfosporosinus sp.]|nr:hypothetical protein [Desulfosporosinus sp.]
MFDKIKDTKDLYRVMILSENETEAQFAQSKESMDYILSKIRNNHQYVKSMKAKGIEEDEIKIVINDYDFFMELCDYLYSNE